MKNEKSKYFPYAKRICLSKNSSMLTFFSSLKQNGWKRKDKKNIGQPLNCQASN